jgi:site-specific DNA recombinase
MKKIALYSRVSTQMQTVGNAHSLDHQVYKITEYCKNNSLKNIVNYQDAGISGKNISDRPAFKRLIESVKNDETEMVIVLALSRFARNVKDTLLTIELFNKHKVRFVSINENIDTQSATGKFVITILSALAEMESSQTSERIRNVLSYRKEKGFCIGNLPFGWNKDENKQLIINKSEQHTLKIIKELTSKGLSINKICAELTRRKRMNKRGIIHWQSCSVWRLQQQQR